MYNKKNYSHNVFLSRKHEKNETHNFSLKKKKKQINFKIQTKLLKSRHQSI